MNHPIDDIFKNKLRNRDFSIDSEDWESAKALIIEEQNRKKRFFWIWIVGILLILALPVAGYHLFWNQQGHEDTADINEGVASHMNESQSSDGLDRSINNGPSSPVITDNLKMHKPPIQADASEKPDPDSGIERSLKNEKNQVSDSQFTLESEQEPQSLSPTISTQLDLSLISTEAGKIAQQKDVLIPVPDKTGVDEEDYLHRAPVIIKGLPISKPGFLHYDLLTRLPGPSTSVSVMQVADSDFTQFKGVHIYGAGLFSPRSSVSQKSFRGYQAGVLYSLRFSRAMELSAGIGVHYQNGTFGVDQTAEVFNRTGTANTIREILQTTPSGVYYLHLPVGLMYHRDRHSVGVSMDISSLIAVRGRQRIQSFDQQALAGVDLDAAMAERISDTNEWLSKDAFHDFYLVGNLHYRYRLNRWMSFGASAGFRWNEMQKPSLPITEQSPVLLRISTYIHLWEQ